jgi:predicted secreted protein
MSTLAISAFQTYLKVGDGESPEEFTTIAELRNVSGPSLSADAIDVTVHNTPTPWRKFISGLLDGGEVSLDINFVPTNATHTAATAGGLVKTMTDRTELTYKIVFPDDSATEWSFPGIITAFEPSSDPADVLQASVTIKVSGPPTLA